MYDEEADLAYNYNYNYYFVYLVFITTILSYYNFSYEDDKEYERVI